MNKIGTYPLALLAKYHNVGFMVVAPTNTIDGNALSGDDIPIEERPEKELFEYIKGDHESIMGLPIKEIISYIKLKIWQINSKMTN